MRKRPLYIGMAAGFAIALVSLIVWRSLVDYPPAETAYSILCCPEYPVFKLLAALFSVQTNHGAGVLLGCVHLLYCTCIGAFIGLIFVALQQKKQAL